MHLTASDSNKAIIADEKGLDLLAQLLRIPDVRVQEAATRYFLAILCNAISFYSIGPFGTWRLSRILKFTFRTSERWSVFALYISIKCMIASQKSLRIGSISGYHSELRGHSISDESSHEQALVCQCMIAMCRCIAGNYFIVDCE